MATTFAQHCVRANSNYYRYWNVTVTCYDVICFSMFHLEALKQYLY